MCPSPRPAEASAAGAPLLLERGPHLDAIRAAVDGAAEGDGRWLVLRGEAGVGKSTLVGAARDLAEQRGLVTLSAQADHLESELPWGVVLQLVAAVSRGDDADLLESGAPARLRPLLTGAGGPDLVAGADPLPLLHALHWLLADLADRRPLLVLLDDVHWSDAASLRALCYLLRRLEGARASVLLAMRPGEPLEEETAGLLASFLATPRVSTVDVHPLQDRSISTLVADALPASTAAFRDAVASAVGGNPFLCAAVLDAVRAEGSAPDDAAAARLRELRPPAIRHSIVLRLAQLGPDATALATAVAVLGPTATPAVARRVAGLAPDASRSALHRLLDAGLLVAGPPLGFAHAIVRESLLHDIGGPRVRHAHTAAASVLRDQGAPAEEVASHLVRGAPVEEGWAVQVLREAAQADLARASPGHAAARLRTALALTTDAGVRLEVLLELGAAETAAGDPAALGRYEAASRLPGGDSDPRAMLLLADALYAAGRSPDATDAYQRGLATQGQGDDQSDPVVEARLLAGLDSASRRDALHEHPLRARIEALVEDPPTGASPADRVLMAAAAGRHALAGDVDRRRVLALATAALDGGLPPALGRIVLEPVTAALMICDELDGALRLLDQVVAGARARGELTAYAGLLPLRAMCAHRRGRLAEAEADATDAIRLADEVPGAPRQALAPAHWVLALAALERGHPAAAVGALSVPDAAERWGATPFHGWYLDACGRVALAVGDHEGALRHFTAAGEAFRAGGGEGTFCGWRAGAAVALHRAGQAPEASALVAEALRLARRFGAPSAIAATLRAAAHLAAADHEVAIAHLEEADAEVRDAQARLEAAHVAVDLGAALRRQGRRRDAREALRRGMDEARRCGATALATRAAEELSAAGARRPAMIISGPDALTPSERRVALLAAGGASNREIAEALFVSRKTVELHLSSTYRKLGISGRDELAGALDGHGLPGSR